MSGKYDAVGHASRRTVAAQGQENSIREWVKRREVGALECFSAIQPDNLID